MEQQENYKYKKNTTEIDAKISDLMTDDESCGDAKMFLKNEKSVFARNIEDKIKVISRSLCFDNRTKPSIGVRKIINALKTPFDAEVVAKSVVQNPNSKYYGQNWEEVVVGWQHKGQVAGAKGVGIDEYAAKLFENVPVDISSWSAEMKSCCNQFEKLKSELLDPIGAELVCREAWVQDTNNIKGRLDALFNIQERLMLVDWKSVAEIPQTNPFGTKMLGPASMLDDCKANDFTLQLYIYKFFLERYFNIKVLSCRIGWIRPTGYAMVKPNFPYNPNFIEECIKFGLETLKQ